MLLFELHADASVDPSLLLGIRYSYALIGVNSSAISVMGSRKNAFLSVLSTKSFPWLVKLLRGSPNRPPASPGGGSCGCGAADVSSRCGVKPFRNR